MKKLSLTLITALFSCFMFAQGIQLRGKVVSISKMKILEEGGDTTISVEYPLRTTFLLRDDRFLIKNMSNAYGYKLFDKDTTKINGDWVISYMAESGKNTYLLAASEIGGCPDHIVIAVFPFTGSLYFTEYLVKISPPKHRKAK
jgi:hypothetical protein